MKLWTLKIVLTLESHRIEMDIIWQFYVALKYMYTKIVLQLILIFGSYGQLRMCGSHFISINWNGPREVTNSKLLHLASCALKPIFIHEFRKKWDGCCPDF